MYQTVELELLLNVMDDQKLSFEEGTSFNVRG